MSASLKAHRVMFNETDKLRPRGPFINERERWERIVELAIAYQERLHIGPVARITSEGRVYEFHDVQPLYDWPEECRQPPASCHDEPRAVWVKFLLRTGRLGYG